MNLQKLKEIFPNAKYGYLEAIAAHEVDLAAAGILGNPKREIHFLAQGAAETAGFTIKVESGDYSAERLLKVFPKYFKSLAEAKTYANRPMAIFNRTYGGRLGNSQPGDGYKYRGRGIFQITGKDAYRAYGEKIGIDLVGDPDLASDPNISIRLAIAYWSDLKLNEWADRDDLLAVSRGINGGNPKRNIQPNGMEHRKSWYAKIKKAFTEEDAQTANLSESGSLREGDSGEEISRLQSALRAKGYPVGAIDGIYGANTRRAVVLFQGEHKLEPVSGVWLTEHWPILEAAENIQIERQAVTATELHKAGDPIVKGLTLSQRILAFLGLGSALTGAASEGASNFPALVTQYQPVIETFGPAIQWMANNGWLIIIMGTIAAWLLLRWAINSIAKAYQHFDYQGQYKKVE